MATNELYRRWLTLAALLAACSSCTRNPEPSLEQARLPKRAFEMNLAGLMSRTPATRREALDVFRRSWPAVRHHVPELTKSSKEPERMAAAYLLAELGTTEDLDLLRGCLDDASAVVRRTAMKGLLTREDRGSSPRLVARTQAAASEELGEILDCLLQLDAAAAEGQALALCGDKAWARRRAALLVMAKLSSQASAQAIAAALGDPTWSVREAAADAAASRRIAATAPRLRALVADTEWQVRAAACRGLAALGQTNDLELVARLALEDASKYARREATRALGSFGRAAVPHLRQLFEQKDADEKVLAHAVEILVGLDGPEAASLLANLHQRPDPVLQQLLADWDSERPAAPGK